MSKQKLISILMFLVIVISILTSSCNNTNFSRLEKEVIIYDENDSVLFCQNMTINDFIDYEASKMYIDTFGYNKEERYKSLEQAIEQLKSLDSIVIKPIYWHRDPLGGKRSFASSATTTWRNGESFVNLFLSVDDAKFDGNDKIEVSISPRQPYGYGGSAKAYLNKSIVDVMQRQLIVSKQRLIKEKVTVSIQGNVPSLNGEYIISE